MGQNRENIKQCLMQCIRTCAYAPRENPLKQINSTKMTEYILWLLGADPIIPNSNDERSSGGVISLHEQLAFDILFEIDAHPEADQVRVLSRILSILQVKAENQHNLKQYKVLIEHLLNRIKNKASIKYLEKFRAKIEKIELNVDLKLNEEELVELENRRRVKVEEIAQEHLSYLSDSEKEEIEQKFGVELIHQSGNEDESVGNNEEAAVNERKRKLRTKKQLRTDQNISILAESEASVETTNEHNRSRNSNSNKDK